MAGSSASDIPSPAWRRAGRVLAVAGLLAIAAITLTPTDDPRRGALLTPLLCLICGDRGMSDVAANLLLFLPFATGLRLAGWSWRRTVAVAAAVSLSVEVLQLFVITGRDASLSDLLTNTTGSAVGAAFGGMLPRLATPSPARAVHLLVVGLLGPMALLSAWAWLLGSDSPRGRLMSRWAHLAPGADVFDGRVLAVRLNGRVMPTDGIPADADRLREEVGGGRVVLQVDVVSGRPVDYSSWIYMFRVRSRGAVTLGQFHRLAVFEVPSRGLRLRFYQPAVTLVDGLPGEAGVPVTLRATERGRQLFLSSTYGGRTRSVAMGITPAYGWILLSPFQFGGTERWLSALCLAVLYFPAGYWAASIGRPRTAAAVLVAGIGVTLLGLSPLAGLAPAPWTEWLGALAGTTIGWAVRRAAAYLETPCVSPSTSEFSSP
ncbi:MAG: VanZ family protein [Gemmatimonadales bacterium]